MSGQRGFSQRPASISVAAGLCIALSLSANAQSDPEVVRGPATAIDGRTLSMNGKRLVLANITVPEPGDKCMMRGTVRDCGRFSTLGLTELVVAATIECRKLTLQTYTCRTEHGYDLGLGQIHAGWAVPAKSAPRHYFAKMDEVRARKRMLWSASHADGSPGYAASLLNAR